MSKRLINDDLNGVRKGEKGKEGIGHLKDILLESVVIRAATLEEATLTAANETKVRVELKNPGQTQLEVKDEGRYPSVLVMNQSHKTYIVNLIIHQSSPPRISPQPSPQYPPKPTH